MALYAINPEIAHGGVLEAPQVTVVTTPQYISEWFAERRNQKPLITVYTDPINRLYHEVKTRLDRNEWEDKNITSFIVAVMKENPEIFQVTSVAEWGSHGRTFVAAGGVVTPLNLLTIEEIPEREVIPDIIVSTPEERKSLMWALLLIYRKALTNAVQAAYGGEVARRMDDFFGSAKIGMVPADAANLVHFIAEDKLSEMYRKLIAAIDMFFYKFQKAPFAAIRMATLPARYRGCVAITAWGLIASLCGVSSQDLAHYILTTHVARDFARIARREQGFGDANGYFPYLLDLELTTRSPYSLSINPTLHLWLHTIGCVIGLPRSINAKFPSGAVDVPSTIVTALAVGLHFSKGANFARQFAAELPRAQAYQAVYREQAERVAAPDDPGSDDEEVEGVIVEDPLGEAVNSVLRALLINKGLSAQQLNLVAQKLTGCRDAGDDTIGHFLSNTYPPVRHH